ncbi:MAG: glycosyltransferase family 2 protein [Lentisphaeria bacterium]|nr:glycosyltransferase family 2 protein [Lentisphaeria bacterium]
MPKLTVIIPVRNEEKRLPRCLQSILAQSFQDWEAICIDDGSRDGTADVLQKFVDNDKRIRGSAFTRHLGTVLARKLALMDAKGDYVMFADADDEFLPGAFANAVRLIEDAGVDILQFAVDITASDDMDVSGFKQIFRHREIQSAGSNILYDCFVNRRFQHNLWNKIYRADVCRKAVENMPDIRLQHYTDQYLTFFLLYFAESFRSVKDGPFYRYHMGGGVSTKRPDAEQFKELCEASGIFPRLEKFLRDRNQYETHVSVLEAMRNTLCCDMIGKMLTIPALTREIIMTAQEHWGSGIVYDFLAETGMFKYPCSNRQHMVSDLIDRTRAQEREIARLRTELETAKQKLRKVTPRSSQSQKNPETPSSGKDASTTPGKPQFRFIQKLLKV